jgi:predicted DNA-binding transcriptional regulator AlpA
MDAHTVTPADSLGRRRRISGGGTAYLTDRELAARWGISTVTLWRMRRRGDLPRPERLSPRRVATRLAIIEAIEAARAAEAGERG